MATGAGKKQSREATERARVYQARQEFHQGLLARRRRDNLIAGVAGGALILAVVGGQIAYYTLGAGAPEPTPSPTATTPATPTPDATPAETPEPTDSATPTP